MNLKFLRLIYVFTSIINNDTYDWKHTMFYLRLSFLQKFMVYFIERASFKHLWRCKLGRTQLDWLVNVHKL